ncbi:MAG: MarR family transcriptional regulator [Ottowia sp.]|uniref:MarR family winged helix-turn-helix transcriptional regulator n=1 Tax=Ottowia sp. TaxID=1898956 RepID=UPI001D8B7BD9|nr:MarR family transcriptional regulator [Ottowia sp.]MCB2025137.1 MarR family transcriptional regulator [Ottowia sp.]MCB2033023.1 MarR family transcriptional regulator [Ottowia sp.]MCB2036062.1 MarR family transcriptional regulator [Ottowia sp.]MCB2070760.1 MarR family transcriptional regulator [Ottowia sp.]HPK31663.1 MarR family transcriptional regulator [Ottowia sp.]
MSKPRKRIDSSFLRTLVGYNARRAALKIMGVFIERMARLELRPVEFSVLSLIGHNPGITSREICRELSLLAPNLVRLLGRLDQRDLVRREAHPDDGRAVGLRLSEAGQALLAEAEVEAAALEVEVTPGLSDAERAQLIALLQRVYR